MTKTTERKISIKLCANCADKHFVPLGLLLCNICELRDKWAWEAALNEVAEQAAFDRETRNEALALRHLRSGRRGNLHQKFHQQGERATVRGASTGNYSTETFPLRAICTVVT